MGSGANAIVSNYGDGGARSGFSLRQDTATTLSLRQVGMGITDFIASGVDLNNYHQVVFMKEGTNYTLWVDGVHRNSSAGNDVVTWVGDGANFGVGQMYSGGAEAHSWQGNLDELYIWNRSLSSAEISDMYNSGNGLFYHTWGVVPSGAIPINIIYPTENETINQDFYINVSINKSGNCEVNNSYWVLDWSNATFFSFLNETSSDGSYSVLVNCTNITGGEHSNATRNFIIDTAFPTITDNFVNNYIYFQDNLVGQFNFTDNISIHIVNITLPLDNIIIFNETGIDETTFQYNLSYDISGLSVGEHILSIYVADGHTASSLGGDYEWDTGLFNDYLRYEFWDDGYVRIDADGSIFDTFTTEKKKDRYIFSYEPSDKDKSSYVFTVKSNQDIYIVDAPKTKYNEWLITGNHWVDFYPYNAEFKRRKDNEVEVTIHTSDDIMKFSSIGDLNIVEKNYTFFTTNATVTFSGSVAELQNQTITLSILTGAGVDETNANFTYNDTYYNLTKSIFPAYDLYTVNLFTPQFPDATTIVTFVWFYNITGLVSTELGNITNNQTVSRIGIDNCSTYTMRAINITVRRDDTNGLQSTDIDGYFEIWVDEMAQFKRFNLTWGMVNQTGICIYPNESTYQIYSQFEYGGTGVYSTETHFLIDYTISNDTSLLDFYLTPNSTAVTFTVTDQDDNDVQGVYIHVLSYDFGTNSHVTTEIIETDEQGEAVGNIVLTTQWYKFLLIYNGAIVLETEPVKITSTERNFRINLLTNFFDFFDVWDNTQTSLTFTNATLNFAYTFINIDGTSVTACLNVVKMTSMRDTLINDTCITASSGTILVNIGTPIDETYKAVGFLRINPDKVTDVEYVSYDMGYKRWGKDGIFVAFFIRMALVTIGIWNPMIAVVLLILADIGMISMGLYAMDIKVFIFYIILGAITVYRLNRK